MSTATTAATASRPPPRADRRGWLRRPRRALARVPRGCLACAAIALVNGALWAIITPPLQVPDEGAHVGYVQYLAEWGTVPGVPKGPHLDSAEFSLAFESIPWSVEGRPTWYAHDVRGLHRRLAHLDRRPGSVGPSAINNPPLYYALDAVPYELGRSAYFFDTLLLMRLLAALLAAVTVAFTFLFVREVLPSQPWAARVGALAVAFQPMFGFMSGGINNDCLLYATGAVLIYLVARTLRRGLTPALGITIGAVAAAGMLTKTSFAGLLPGAALGIILALWRARPEQRRRALAGAAGAGATLAVLFGAWLIASQTLFDRSAAVTTGGFTSSTVSHVITLKGQLSYLWQVFLPPLPGMASFSSLKDSYPLWDTYFNGLVGRFGWWRFGFPEWVNWLALGVYCSVLALVATGLVRARAAVRRRWPEVLTYTAIAAGFVLLVEIAAYRYQAVNGGSFEQTRYLFPLLAFYGALVAIGAQGAGRKWGPAVGAFLVVLAMGHSLFSMLLVISRYYA